jgi:hypothetical protein
MPAARRLLHLGAIAASALTLVGVVADPARAVIVLDQTVTGTSLGSGRNISTVEPIPNALGNYTGTFGQYLGTPIASRYFVTAAHIGDGGSAGKFFFNNGTLTTTEYDVELAGVENDLAVWRVKPTDADVFSVVAPLLTNPSPTNRPLVTVGRGVARGAEVTFPQSGGTRRGWLWAGLDSATTWGTNNVTGIDPGSVSTGPLLYFNFDNNGVADEAVLADKDSGGPTFVQDVDNVWKLGGVNYGVNGSFSYTPDDGAVGGTSPYFGAALFDMRGFYYGDEANHVQISGASPVPAASFATPLASHLPFLLSTAGVPEPTGFAALFAAAAVGAMRRRRGPAQR